MKVNDIDPTDPLFQESLDRQKALLPRYLATMAFVDALRACANDGQRRRMIEHVGRHVCLHCGDLHLPCYCKRDD